MIQSCPGGGSPVLSCPGQGIPQSQVGGYPSPALAGEVTPLLGLDYPPGQDYGTPWERT